jgi:hypothetical protein
MKHVRISIQLDDGGSAGLEDGGHLDNALVSIV